MEVHDGDKIYNRVDVTDKDIEDFIESFDNDQLQLIINFFQTMPKVRHIMNVTNPKTKVKSEIVLEGLESFLGQAFLMILYLIIIKLTLH